MWNFQECIMQSDGETAKGTETIHGFLLKALASPRDVWNFFSGRNLCRYRGLDIFLHREVFESSRRVTPLSSSLSYCFTGNYYIYILHYSTKFIHIFLNRIINVILRRTNAAVFLRNRKQFLRNLHTIIQW